MIAIVNVTHLTPAGARVSGKDNYELRINQQVLTDFTHIRSRGGVAQCLRDAADAYELSDTKKVLDGDLDHWMQVLNASVKHDSL